LGPGAMRHGMRGRASGPTRLPGALLHHHPNIGMDRGAGAGQKDLRDPRGGKCAIDYRNAFDLTGSVAVVIGGSRGIGLETAMALGVCGAKVILASRDRKALDESVSKLMKAGADASSFALDITDAAAVTKAADAIVVSCGKVDILVNSAGIARLNSALETPDDEWRAVMDVNVNGMFWCCGAFGRHMVAAHKGAIVNLGYARSLASGDPGRADDQRLHVG